MRPVVARAGELVLAVPAAGDEALVAAAWDGAFDVDPDDGPRPEPFGLTRASVLVGGELLGLVGWHQVQWGRVRSCGAWNLGIGLLPAARGRGVGTAALRLLAEHLFAVADLDRVQAGTDVDNVPAQRALEAAGLRREGVVRGAQVRGGVRRDLVLYGMLRSDLG